jgi:hypothetical protein
MCSENEVIYLVMQKFKLLLSENIMVFSPADVEDKFPTTIW